MTDETEDLKRLIQYQNIRLRVLDKLIENIRSECDIPSNEGILSFFKKKKVIQKPVQTKRTFRKFPVEDRKKLIRILEEQGLEINMRDSTVRLLKIAAKNMTDIDSAYKSFIVNLLES